MNPEPLNIRKTWHELPMLARYPVVAGVLAGIALRLVFSGPGGSHWSPMVAAFIFGAPILLGMLTVFLAERHRRRSWTYYFLAPLMTTSLFVIGTLILLIEGWICAIVIIPMFAVLGGLAGMLMGLICRLTNWPTPAIQCAAAMPIVLAFLGPLIPTPSAIGSIERSIVIDAAPAIVWRSINDIRDIEASEMSDALALRIGVPAPISGVTADTPSGRVRHSRWGKQVHFEEVIQDWQPEQYVRWTYRFSSDSFPRHALDDHVVIGGHYFDVLDTSFVLQPVNDGKSTQVTTHVRYRIATQFNFYADWVAQILLANLSEVGLALYKSRSEEDMKAAHVPVAGS